MSAVAKSSQSSSVSSDESSPPLLPPAEVVQAILTGGAATGESSSFLTNRHVKELRRRGKGIRDGYLVIKIADWQITAIGDARFHLF